MNAGRHHAGEHQSADTYGRHDESRASGLSVAELLERMIGRGEAVRLAWRGEEATNMTARSDDFPTAVLPQVQDEFPDTDDEGTEPTTAIRETRQWRRTRGFTWWPKPLAG